MTDLIRAIVVDDEAPSRVNLGTALEEYPEWSLEGAFSNVASAMGHLDQHPVDAVFLDIQMPRENGLTMARRLSALASPPVVIFVTAFDHFAIEAFQVHALDYLLKPFDDLRFRQTLERAAWMVRLKQQPMYGDALRDCLTGIESKAKGQAVTYLQNVIVRSAGRIEVIPVKDIHWISSAGNYVELHLGNRIVLHRIPMAHLDRHLDPSHFLRVHRTAFVRKRSISGFESNGANAGTLVLHSQDRVPVSPKYMRSLKEALSGL